MRLLLGEYQPHFFGKYVVLWLGFVVVQFKTIFRLTFIRVFSINVGEAIFRWILAKTILAKVYNGYVLSMSKGNIFLINILFHGNFCIWYFLYLVVIETFHPNKKIKIQ